MIPIDTEGCWGCKVVPIRAEDVGVAVWYPLGLRMLGL